MFKVELEIGQSDSNIHRLLLLKTPENNGKNVKNCERKLKNSSDKRSEFDMNIQNARKKT